MNKQIQELIAEIKKGNVSQEEMLALLEVINSSLGAYKDFLEELKLSSSIQAEK